MTRVGRLTLLAIFATAWLYGLASQGTAELTARYLGLSVLMGAIVFAKVRR